MALATILVIAIGALMFVLLVRTGERTLARQAHDPARERDLWVVRERFAAGDIDAEQYQRIAHALRR
jgi:uncharacterized membrane protein